MRLVILGATGGIGRLLLRYALERGHEVTAFVRSPQKITLKHERLKVVQGNLLDAGQLATVMAGHDAVLSAFGPITLGPTTMRALFGRAVAEAMRLSAVRRILLVSSAFLFSEMFFFGRVLRGMLFGNVVVDDAGMELAICRDYLDWTIVRPPRLTNGSLTQKYRVMEDRLPEGRMRVSRADVADFMLHEVEKPAHRQQIVGVAG
jgi:putative NADH-flavin reductase